ncbi:MAG: FG-GAP repeat protein, partial [Deltaproteobacteria bacterium]|nr:FG-GAP repeat protein [Deltaproteobacteria bacterium]
KDWSDEVVIVYSHSKEYRSGIEDISGHEDDGLIQASIHSEQIYIEVFDDINSNFNTLLKEKSPLESRRLKCEDREWCELFLSLENSILEGPYFNLAMGDMDGDGRDEIAIAAIMDMGYWDGTVISYYSNVDLFVMDHDFTTLFDSHWDCEEEGDQEDCLYHPKLDIDHKNNRAPKDKYPRNKSYLTFFDKVDINGDQIDELVVGDRLVGIRDSKIVEIEDKHGKTMIFGQSDRFHIDQRDLISVSFGNVNGPEYPYHQTSFAFSGDLREDLIFLTNLNGSIENAISSISAHGYAYRDKGDYGEEYWLGGYYYWAEELNAEYEKEAVIYPGNTGIRLSYIDSRPNLNGSIENAIVVAANVDDDSIIVEHVAENPEASLSEKNEGHTTFYGDTKIIAILAVPPAIDGVNTEKSSSTFGTAKGVGTKISGEMSHSAGVLVGIELGPDAMKIEKELEVKVETTFSADKTTSENTSVTYTTDPKEDLVIFWATPYDRYRYNIVRHPDHKIEGQGFVVSVPQRPQIYCYWISDYNDINGAQMDIGVEILKHTPGDVYSYPDEKWKVDTLKHFDYLLIDDGQRKLKSTVTPMMETDTYAIGNSGTQEIGWEKEDELAGGTSIGLSVDYVDKTCGLGVCLGYSLGWSGTAGLETSWSEGTHLAGTLGSIGLEDEPYNVGIFGYQQTLTDAETGEIVQDFIVLNYWVE